MPHRSSSTTMTGHDVKTTSHWIAGRSAAGNVPGIDIIDPATGTTVGRVDYADQTLMNETVEAAQAAYPGWRDTPWPRRATIIQNFRARLIERIEDLAEVITAEHGKTLEESRQEVQRALEAVDMAAGIGTHLKGEVSSQVGNGVDTFSTRHPLGVCAAVAPFNFPALLSIMPIVAAISAGNALILKPSEVTPSASLIIAEAARDAGVPAGILSILHGDRALVEGLIDHPKVEAIAFVGSTRAAASVYARAAQHGKRAQTFGSAKNHLIAMPDADLESTVSAVVSGAFGATGQRCMAVSVLVAVGEAADRLIPRVVEAASKIVVGDGRNLETNMGPLVSGASRDRVLRLVEGAVSSGAEPLLDRRSIVVDGFENGYFIGPVILDGVTTDMEVYQEEVFGPVLCIMRVDTLDDAIQLIRDNRYGNGAALFTTSGVAARKFEREAEAGQIGINVPVPVPIATFGSAGWNSSTFGDTQMNAGAYQFFTKPKFVTTRW